MVKRDGEMERKRRTEMDGELKREPSKCMYKIEKRKRDMKEKQDKRKRRGRRGEGT